MNVKSFTSKYWGELVFTFSNFFSLGLSMIAGIIATAFIEPEDMGVIQALMLVSSYLGFLQLGVFNGLNRNLAYYKAQGKFDLVQDMVNTTYTTSYIVAAIGGVVALGILAYSILVGKSTVYILSSLLLFFTLVFQPLTTAIETTYRSGQEFKRLGIIKNIESTFFAVLSLLPIILAYIGKIIADSSKSVIGFFMRLHKMPYQRTGRGSFKSYKLLLWTGFPMLISNYAWTVFVACDRTFIAKFLTMEDLGLYSLSFYVITAVMVLPSSFNSLLYPKAATNYGATQDVHCLKSFWKKSIGLYIAVLVPLCLGLYFLLPFLVENYMHKYIGGIRAAQYSLLTCLTFVSLGPSVIFATLRRNTFYIIILILSTIIFWGIALIFKSFFSSIETVAILRFIISFLQMVAVLIVSYIYISK